MKIVVLDGHTLNPGDLDWSSLQSLGDCVIHPRTRADDIVARAWDAEIVLTNKCALTAGTLALLPKLRYIGVLATGYNVVDVAAAAQRGVVTTNVPAYGTRSVAQHVFALLLELSNQVGHHAQSVRAGGWTRSPDWCYWERPLVELEGLTLGIVGYGRIGRAVAELGRAFGMRVVVHSRSETPGADKVSLDELFRVSDVVSLHCPLTPETRELVNRDRLALMKSSAWLINTSRGPLVNETDLARALQEGRLAGAAVDVLSAEPPGDNPLCSLRNCLVTPHVAWATGAARARLLEMAVANVRAFLAGRSQNVVK